MSHTKGELTIKEYGAYDSLYLDGKCMCSGASKEISHRLRICWNSHDDLLAACKNALPLIAGERIGYDAFPPIDELAKSLAKDMKALEQELIAAIDKAQPSKTSVQPMKSGTSR